MNKKYTVKQIKNQLSKKYPDVRFVVKSKTYSMGNKTAVDWDMVNDTIQQINQGKIIIMSEMSISIDFIRLDYVNKCFDSLIYKPTSPRREWITDVLAMNLPDGPGCSPDGGEFWANDGIVYWSDGDTTDLRQGGIIRQISSGYVHGNNYYEEYLKKNKKGP